MVSSLVATEGPGISSPWIRAAVAGWAKTAQAFPEKQVIFRCRFLCVATRNARTENEDGISRIRPLEAHAVALE